MRSAPAGRLGWREVRCAWVRPASSPAGTPQARRAHAMRLSEAGKAAVAQLSAGAGSSQSSISHTGDLVLAAIAGRRLGVDVQAYEVEPPSALLMSRTVTPHEREQLLRLPEPDRVRAWYRLWARREALGKCLGSGWSGPAVRLGVDRGIVVSRTPAGVWWLTDLPAPAGHAAALATPFPPSVSWVSPSG